MTILITGINGFIGSALANHFIKIGYDVIGLGRRPKLGQHVNSLCRYIIADITRPLESIVCDYVIHTAGITDDKKKYDEHYLTNVIGTQNVLNATEHAKGFVYISSSSVYSFREKKAYKESDAENEMKLLSYYGKSKLLAEKSIALYCKQPYLILRPRAVYGPGDTVLLPRLVELIKGNKLFLPSHITKKICLTHIYNLVQIVSASIEENKINNMIFNVSDDKLYSLKVAIKYLLLDNKELKPDIISIPSFLWDSLVFFNSIFKINQKITRFGSRQLTSEAVMDINAAKSYFKGCLYADLYYKESI